MAIFNESDIKNIFADNLEKAKKCLKKLEVFCGDEPKFNGLSGWVFEKTILYCIRKELNDKRITHDIVEQFSLGGRRKADLTVGNVAIEIKSNGFFDRKKDPKRCRECRKAANKKGASRYVVMSLEGSDLPLWKKIRGAIGNRNVFCLFFKHKQQNGEWKRFIDLLCSQKAN